MKHLIKLGAAAAFMGAAFAPLGEARAADPAAGTATERRPVDARVVRVKLEGVVDLRIRQGATPALVLSGDPRLVGRTVSTQRGDLLAIETEGRNSGMSFGRSGGVQAELVLPGLRAVSSESVGATTVSGFSGDSLEINLDGAGSMNVSSDYRNITASLGGVGSLKIQGIDSERIDLNLGGAGYVTLSGRSKQLRAELGGLGSLDAQAMPADAVTLELSGLGNATVHARSSASLALSGMGSVTVFGKPANRKVVLDGLGKVSWK